MKGRVSATWLIALVVTAAVATSAIGAAVGIVYAEHGEAQQAVERQRPASLDTLLERLTPEDLSTWHDSDGYSCKEAETDDEWNRCPGNPEYGNPPTPADIENPGAAEGAIRVTDTDGYTCHPYATDVRELCPDNPRSTDEN
jgi:hypothetical protein